MFLTSANASNLNETYSVKIKTNLNVDADCCSCKLDINWLNSYRIFWFVHLVLLLVYCNVFIFICIFCFSLLYGVSIVVCGLA